MKKALRFILAGVVALLAVSCYDDSALQEKVDKLDGRLTAVENTLNQEVADLAALVSQFKTLEGKVAAIKVETKDGLTTLTLSNGSSVVLSKDGVLTMVDGGWATVAPNGDVTPLNIPVSQKLKFIVEGNILKVSYDDGKTYESTGVEVAEPTAHVIGNIVVAEDGKSVAITIGDNTLSLPLVSSAVATLGLSRDNFFLQYNGKREVEITAAGLEDIYVMNEPDGWRASVANNILTILAPTAKAVDADAAAAEGLVLVHATTTEGKCIVAKLEVTTGPGFNMELKGDVLHFTNAYVQVETDEMGEVFDEYFANYAVGIVPVSEVEDEEEFFQFILDEYEPYAGGYGNMQYCWVIERPEYQEGVCEIEHTELSIKDYFKWVSLGAVEPGVEYLIYAAPTDMERGLLVLDELVKCNYTLMVSDVEVADSTFNDATLNMTLAGAPKFYVGLCKDPAVEYGPTVTLEMVLSEGGFWAFIQNDALDMIERFAVEPGEHNILASSLNFDEKLDPATKYYYWAFPYVEGVKYTDYATQFEPYVGSFETAPLLPGGPETPLAEGEKAYDKVYANITVPESSYVKYAFYSLDAWAEFDEDEDAIRADLMGGFYECTESEMVQKTASPGQSFVLAAVAISNDGKYGEVNNITLTAKEIVKTNDFSATLDYLIKEGTTYKAVVSVTGATKFVGYNITAPEAEEQLKSTKSTIEGNIAKSTGTYRQYQWVEAVEGKVTFTFTESSAKKDYFVYGYTVDQNGKLEMLQEKPLIINIANNLFTFDLQKLEVGGGTLLNLAAPWSEIESGSKDYDIYVKMNTAAGVEWKVSATKNGEAYTDPNSPMLNRTYAGNAQSDHMWVPLNNTNDPIEWALTVTTTYAGKEFSKTVQFTQKGAPVVEQDFFNIVKVHNGGLGQLNLTEPWSEIPATFDWTNMPDGTTDLYVNVEASKTWSISVTKNGEPYSHSGGVFGKEYAGSRQSDHIWLTPNTTGAPVEWAVTVTALVNGEQVAKTIKFTQKAN